MGIEITCRCGHGFDAGLALAGETVRCPACGDPVIVATGPVRPLGEAHSIRIEAPPADTEVIAFSDESKSSPSDKLAARHPPPATRHSGPTWLSILSTPFSRHHVLRPALGLTGQSFVWVFSALALTAVLFVMFAFLARIYDWIAFGGLRDDLQQGVLGIFGIELAGDWPVFILRHWIILGLSGTVGLLLLIDALGTVLERYFATVRVAARGIAGRERDEHSVRAGLYYILLTLVASIPAAAGLFAPEIWEGVGGGRLGFDLGVRVRLAGLVIGLAFFVYYVTTAVLLTALRERFTFSPLKVAGWLWTSWPGATICHVVAIIAVSLVGAVLTGLVVAAAFAAAAAFGVAEPFAGAVDEAWREIRNVGAIGDLFQLRSVDRFRGQVDHVAVISISSTATIVGLVSGAFLFHWGHLVIYRMLGQLEARRR